MNERIEHITKQVDEYFDDLSIEFSREAWMEKFAELIVKECKSVILDMMDKKQGDFNTLDLSLTEINEHFGVEDDEI